MTEDTRNNFANEIQAMQTQAGSGYTSGQAQQNRINDLLKSFSSGYNEKVGAPSEWNDTQLRLAARNIFNATQQIPNRNQFSREQLEAMGSAKGDVNAFTSHPMAQQVWESSIASGTMPFRNIGYNVNRPNFQDMSREQLQQMVSGFIGGNTAPSAVSQPTGMMATPNSATDYQQTLEYILPKLQEMNIPMQDFLKLWMGSK